MKGAAFCSCFALMTACGGLSSPGAADLVEVLPQDESELGDPDAVLDTGTDEKPDCVWDSAGDFPWGSCCASNNYLLVEPSPIAFGGVEVDTVKSLDIVVSVYGTSQTEVSWVTFGVGSNPAFGVRFPDTSPPSHKAPWRVSPGEKFVFSAIYQAGTGPNPTDPDTNQPIPDMGVLRIESDACIPMVYIPVSGWTVSKK